MNKTFFLPLILLFFVFYFLVFPVDSGVEVFWKASELYDFENIDNVPVSLDKPMILNQGMFKGVLRRGTGRSFLEKEAENTAYSETHLFRKSGDSLVIEDLTNHDVLTLSRKGYPLSLGEHRYLVDFGSAYLEEIDESGKSLWSWHGVSPVTAIVAGKGLTVFGSIDGRVRFFTSGGVMTEVDIQDKTPDQVIYGLALSGDNRTLAVIAGQNQQSVIQYSLSGNGPPLMIHKSFLDDQFRKPVKLLFSYDGSYLWVEQKKSIVQFYNGEVNQILTLEGSFLTHMLDEEEGIYYLLTKLYTTTEARYQLTAYTLNGAVLMKNQFREYPEYFNTDGARVFMSMDKKMVVLSREES